MIRGKRLLYILIDSIIITSAYILSFFIEFYSVKSTINIQYLLINLFLLLGSFYILQIYRIMWEYSSIKDIYRLLLSNMVGFLALIIIYFFLNLEHYRMIIVLSFLITASLTVFYRMAFINLNFKMSSSVPYRYENILKEGKSRKRDKGILIVGAGEAGSMIMNEFYHKGLDKRVAGFIDDDTTKIGKIVNGKMVLAPTSKINDIILKYNINMIAIAMPSVDVRHINRIVSIIKTSNPDITIRILPPFTSSFDRKPLIFALRDIGVEDLIGREEFNVDCSAIEFDFTGKTILITGAGGSIGSEICRQILKFRIKRLIAVGKGEHSIYNLINNLQDHVDLLDYKLDIIYKIADIRDQSLMNQIFEEYKPEVIFHTAAHKHVPLMEHNEIEAIHNNILGTKILLDLSKKYLIGKFIFISTDKAVNPVNIMGATKRIAELLILYYYREIGLNASCVRFGNVIGSRGSVIPHFCKQIERGGPVTITHPEMRRFFMTITEASLLVINAAAYSKGGEIFILDMGEQYKILDIAKKIIRLYGYEPEKDIRIIFTGLRPGEKLNEELISKREDNCTTDNEKIFVLNSKDEIYNKEVIENFMNYEIFNIFDYDSDQIRNIIVNIVPEYRNLVLQLQEIKIS